MWGEVAPADLWTLCLTALKRAQYFAALYRTPQPPQVSRNLIHFLRLSSSLPPNKKVNDLDIMGIPVYLDLTCCLERVLMSSTY